MADARRPRETKAAPDAAAEPRHPLSADELRRQAEERLAGLAEVAARVPEELAAAVHELRVHQIELEMQNEELRRAQRALEASRAKYFALFDLAPVGYVTLDHKGHIVAANLPAARLLGVERASLLGQHLGRFVLKEDRDRYYLHLRSLVGDAARAACEVRLARPPEEPPWVRLESTTFASDDGEQLHRRTIISEIGERKQAEEALVLSARELHEQLRDTVKAMGAIVSLRDPYTAAHELRVTELAVAIAREMGLGEEALEGLAFAGEVHDIGKVGIPAEILSKPGALTKMEYALIKQHPQAGRDLLAAIRFRQPVAEIVGQHQERLDGSGYPDGLKGNEIMLEARILAVADVVEAMASHRPYRASLGLESALAEVRAGAGGRYDADAVAACERVFAEGFVFSES